MREGIIDFLVVFFYYIFRWFWVISLGFRFLFVCLLEIFDIFEGIEKSSYC